MDTTTWIGTTEVYALFASLGIRSTVFDFCSARGAGASRGASAGGEPHTALFQMVKRYFSAPTAALADADVACQTGLPPLYLQHDGHSRTIVG